MELTPLEKILQRRAEIAKKMALYETLMKEDAELETAQRVLERMTGVTGSLSAAASPGAETSVMNVLANSGGRIEFDELHEKLPDIKLTSLRSILSRMKGKELIDRDQSLILLKEKKKEEGPKGPSPEDYI